MSDLEALRARARARAQQSQPQENVIATTRDGGRIIQNADGSRQFTSPGMSTTDPATIDRLMQGATPAQASRAGMQEQYVQDRPIASRAATAISGVPFVGSYADEAVGAIAGPQARDEMRFAQEAMQDTRPVQSAGLQLGGGMAAAAPLGLAAQGTRLGQGITGIAQRLLGQSAVRRTAVAGGIGAATGATEGAIYGYGAGDDGDRAQSAGAGAAFGGLVGGGLAALLPGVGSGIRSVAERLRNNPERAAAGALGVSPNTARVVRSLVGQEPPQRALDNIATAGPGAMLADAGDSTRNMLDAAMRVPGPGQGMAAQRIDARAQQAGQNIGAALDNALGAPQGRLAVQDSIRDAARPNIAPAYEQAYAMPIDYSSPAGRRIEDIISRLPPAQARAAIAGANDRMVWERMPSQVMASIDDGGKVSFQEMPTVIQLDYLKRYFDGVARDGTDRLTQTMDENARFASGIAREIREAIKEATGGADGPYARALATSADSFAEQAAVDFGAIMMQTTVTREVAKRRIADMSPAEIQAAKLGARQYIDDVIANVRAVASDQNIDARQAQQAFSDLSRPSTREKLSALLGDEADDLFRQMDEAGVALGLRASTAANTRTAGRQEGIKMIRDGVEPSAVQRAIANPTQAWNEAYGALTGTSRAMTEAQMRESAAEIIDILTRTGGPEAERALRILQDANIGQPLAEAQARQIATAFQQAIASGGYLGLTQMTGPR